MPEIRLQGRDFKDGKPCDDYEPGKALEDSCRIAEVEEDFGNEQSENEGHEMDDSASRRAGDDRERHHRSGECDTGEGRKFGMEVGLGGRERYARRKGDVEKKPVSRMAKP